MLEELAHVRQPAPGWGGGAEDLDALPGGMGQDGVGLGPFTPAIQTLRGLLLGTPIGDNAIIAIAWSIGITLASYLWARKLLRRDPSRS
jgi:ABC-2 type transport system permease protein